MATIHLPGAGDAAGRRRMAVVAGVVLACAAIAAPFGLRGLDRDHPVASAATRQTEGNPAAPSASHPHHRSSSDTALGRQADLPPLLAPGPPSLRAGQAVRVGDVTEGTLRRTPRVGWQVMVRWDGRLQPVPTHGPVSLGSGSWVARSGLLYTRVATSTPGRYVVYAWSPQGGSAYTVPTLLATRIGDVCFNASFTAFGDCHVAS